MGFKEVTYLGVLQQVQSQRLLDFDSLIEARGISIREPWIEISYAMTVIRPFIAYILYMNTGNHRIGLS